LVPTCDLHVLFLSSDVQDLAHLVLAVGLGADDEQAVQEVDGDAVRAAVIGAPDLGDATVGGGHEDGRHVVLQGPIQKAEALYVQHVHLR
jgi:hypothetical protein